MTARRRAQTLGGSTPRLDQPLDEQRDIAGILRPERISLDDDILLRHVSRGGEGASGQDREEALCLFFTME